MFFRVNLSGCPLAPTQEMDKLAKQIGRNARGARTAAGLTQSEVAEQVGLATEVYGRLERGGMLPSVPTLLKVAEVLRVTPGDLLASALRSRKPSRSPAELRRIVRLLEGADVRTLRRVLVVVKAMLK